jgi:hypothetical protein
MMGDDKLVCVGVYSSRIQAEHVQAILASEGIDAIVSADDAGGLRPELQLTSGVKLLVRKKDKARVEEVAKALEKKTDVKDPELHIMRLQIQTKHLNGVFICSFLLFVSGVYSLIAVNLLPMKMIMGVICLAGSFFMFMDWKSRLLKKKELEALLKRSK